ncbi:PPM-type phosphatase domain-containing protein [Mycena venus]|uniref:PPM-type phosphatase domain-containing protein n=1 Tax=Mycena venus TaxID=2733690 RepID=A0A8H7CX86_9AGAR|nr:PPM-type phosphatase domain-containing protein [Mycena venus]
MAAHFARFGFRARSTSRLFLGLSAGSLGAYYASTFRKIHADTNEQGPQQGRRESYSLRPHSGVQRVDTVFWPSNYPSEDVVTSMYVRPTAWSFWAVYDGHVGPQTAWHLEKHLLPNLAESLYDLYSKGAQPEAAAIHSAIKDVFLSLDDDILECFIPLALAPAPWWHSYDRNVRTLHVSVVGDSRAILGRRRKTEDGKMVYDVHVLSLDQNGKNPDEVALRNAEHPGEKLFEGARYVGWGISRSFGNGSMKWSKEVQTFMQEKCLGNKPRATLLTPPYFTATPETTSTDIQPGDFMIMASDGLWDCLTNEEAVGLVGLWLERQENGANTPLNGTEQAIERTDLPVVLTDDQTNYPNWDVKKRFVNVDSNVARHLARNALGGADTDLHVALLSTPAPRSRYFRDDVSAIVVFFE